MVIRVTAAQPTCDSQIAVDSVAMDFDLDQVLRGLSKTWEILISAGSTTSPRTSRSSHSKDERDPQVSAQADVKYHFSINMSSFKSAQLSDYNVFSPVSSQEKQCRSAN